ncbi:hypothetical protein K431DRAFT_220007 [Polychaeton citri CBS 116435]|uniref:Dopey N-terminal domain-containing protein n=1 Tax=Polychaeton citri CBS 116435 TaxID=1314669 RepID=A0A9P4USS4_9PEZI|nr:hypothetical protein K431DRAFT_220007 [Polychaeton citri CBS 116435]
MNLDPLAGRRSVSPASSGRSSPVPRLSRRAVEDGLFKSDKSLRRYATAIERTLNTWQTSPEDWADYIAFLGRLLKTLQTHPNEVPLIPHSDAVATKLAQCLNPALPSGVHQKALEVYNYIFTLLGPEKLAGELSEYLPGLSGVLSFASLTVRPGLYTIFDGHILKLSSAQLRPALKALVLCLLPALEDEGSDDFETAHGLLLGLQQKFEESDDAVGYFWQCIFLTVMTSSSRRQGALNYLVRRLPRLDTPSNDLKEQAFKTLSSEAEALIQPEPGLLIRCFARGLSDTNALTQRGFLDLLVSHLPLHSPLIQTKASPVDVECLISAALQVLLRRDMSLNRRLWSWFLGPEPKEAQPWSSTELRQQSFDGTQPVQLHYFAINGREFLEQCLLGLFRNTSVRPQDKARPFRICLSLMDKWEIGGTLIPRIFIAAIRTVYDYSIRAQKGETAEVIKSASLFFDSVESHLIWANLFALIQGNYISSRDETKFFAWVVQHFNIREEDMLTVHIPCVILYILESLRDDTPHRCSGDVNNLFEMLVYLVGLVPARAFESGQVDSTNGQPAACTFEHDKQYNRQVADFYNAILANDATVTRPLSPSQLGVGICYQAAALLKQLLGGQSDHLKTITELFTQLLFKCHHAAEAQRASILEAVRAEITMSVLNSQTMPFSTLDAMLDVIVAFRSHSVDDPVLNDFVIDVAQDIIANLWAQLSSHSPRYHVEAVHRIWQVEDLVAPNDAVRVSLAQLTHFTNQRMPLTSEQHLESMQRFATLWAHSVSSTTTPISQTKAPTLRRGSSFRATNPSDVIQRRTVLYDALLLCLDALRDSTTPSFEFIQQWLATSPTLEYVIESLLDGIFEDFRKVVPDGDLNARSRREHTQRLQNFGYCLTHLHNLLAHISDPTLLVMMRLSKPINSPDSRDTSAVELLAIQCAKLISSNANSLILVGKGIEVLSILLKGSASAHLAHLNLDSLLIEEMLKRLESGTMLLESDLLQLLSHAIRVHLDSSAPEMRSLDTHASLTDHDRGANPSPQPNKTVEKSLPIVTSPPPPPRLLDLIRAGFASRSARLHMERWLSFLESILPTYAGAIFTSLMPLVEHFCAQIETSFNEVLTLSTSQSSTGPMPDLAVVGLLQGLEMILAQAHRTLMEEMRQDVAAKAPDRPAGIFGNAATGVFRPAGLPHQNSRSNSRLTVVLTFHDTVRVCQKIWAWSSANAEASSLSGLNSMTIAHQAMRLRSKSRHLLEQVFAVEPLECLEVVVSSWCNASNALAAEPSIRLLHVMTRSRPKSIVPALLDSVCSRVVPTTLSSARSSSLTVDMTAIDVMLFTLDYLRSIEDDAMDEVWPECITFIRDALANPLPYRQVLPVMLSMLVILTEKFGNTNFGEQRKMRRELTDTFQKLLSATMTALPSSIASDTSPDGPSNNVASTNLDLIKNDGAANAISILISVVDSLDMLLDTPERVQAATSVICTNIITPNFHAKTFPVNITGELLRLALAISRKAPSSKPWRRDLTDVFADSRLFNTSPSLMESHWFPLLQQWTMGDRERMNDVLTRLPPPSSAGIMFGVGANAARLDADRKTQYNLRRACLLLLSAPANSHVTQIDLLEERLTQLFEATHSSSPSFAVKAELFMLYRAILLSTDSAHIAGCWPTLSQKMKEALTGLLPHSAEGHAFTNIALLEACKLLDQLVVMLPDEFQLCEWLYIADTSDAVYRPADLTSVALADQVSTALALSSVGESNHDLNVRSTSANHASRKLLLGEDFYIDAQDIKAMSREEFAKTVARPFLSQLSMHAYEVVYRMSEPDLDDCRRHLLDDILDVSTIAE